MLGTTRSIAEWKGAAQRWLDDLEMVFRDRAGMTDAYAESTAEEGLALAEEADILSRGGHNQDAVFVAYWAHVALALCLLHAEEDILLDDLVDFALRLSTESDTLNSGVSLAGLLLELAGDLEYARRRTSVAARFWSRARTLYGRLSVDEQSQDSGYPEYGYLAIQYFALWCSHVSSGSVNDVQSFLERFEGRVSLKLSALRTEEGHHT